MINRWINRHKNSIIGYNCYLYLLWWICHKWGFALISGGTADQKNYTLNRQMGFYIFLYLSGTFFSYLVRNWYLQITRWFLKCMCIIRNKNLPAYKPSVDGECVRRNWYYMKAATTENHLQADKGFLTLHLCGAKISSLCN